LLELDFRDDTIQESSAVIITADAVMIADITVNIVILDNVSIANNSYTWHSDRYK